MKRRGVRRGFICGLNGRPDCDEAKWFDFGIPNNASIIISRPWPRHFSIQLIPATAERDGAAK